MTFIVLLGTIFPLLVEATENRQVTVGGPYFRETTIPFFLLLLFLVGVGPLLSWRRSSAQQVRRRVIVPASDVVSQRTEAVTSASGPEPPGRGSAAESTRAAQKP